MSKMFKSSSFIPSYIVWIREVQTCCMHWSTTVFDNLMCIKSTDFPKVSHIWLKNSDPLFVTKSWWHALADSKSLQSGNTSPNSGWDFTNCAPNRSKGHGPWAMNQWNGHGVNETTMVHKFTMWMTIQWHNNGVVMVWNAWYGTSKQVSNEFGCMILALNSTSLDCNYWIIIIVNSWDSWIHDWGIVIIYSSRLQDYLHTMLLVNGQWSNCQPKQTKARPTTNRPPRFQAPNAVQSHFDS